MLHIPEVVKIGERKHSGKLLAQAGLHRRFGRINSVLGKSARFDIPIEDEDLMARQGDLLCGEQTGGTGPHYENALQLFLLPAHDTVQLLSEFPTAPIILLARHDAM
jgi:hypothetical protein